MRAAAAQGVPVITSDFFSRKDMLPGLGPAPQFMDAVFTQQEKSPPDEASSSQGIVIYQLLAVKPAATPSFEEIKSRVEDEFKNERSNVLLTQKAQELSDRAKAEHDLKRAAKELGATMKTSDLVAPEGQVPEVGSMSGQAAVAFTMKPGEITGPINNGSDASVLQILAARAAFGGRIHRKEGSDSRPVASAEAAGALRTVRQQRSRPDDKIWQDPQERRRTQGA